MPVWRRISDSNAGFVYSLSDALSIVEWRHPGLLLPVSDGVMFVASDYSGQHKGATHEAYSFLVTTNRALVDWEPIRAEFRDRWLPDGRRVSFKQLREPMRRRALVPFLDAAGQLRGNLLTILIDARIRSFTSDLEEVAKVFPDCFHPGTRKGTIEKMYRLAILLAMITAGFRREDQRSVWISDHDETLESFDRREGFARLASYLTYGLTRWQNPADQDFGTTESSSYPEWVEDTAAIADLIAGASCSVSKILPSFCGTELWRRVIPSSTIRDWRTRTIGNWLAISRCTLRQVLLRLELDDDGEARASAQFYAGALPTNTLDHPQDV